MPKITFDPVPMTVPENVAGLALLDTFLGHHDFRVFFTPTIYVDIGRGCLHSVSGYKFSHGNIGGSLGRLGQLCELAECALITFGTHRNDMPINNAFSGIPLLQQTLMREGLFHEFIGDPQPVEIGSNVVLSRGCIVLPGVKIADGCVIGAGAVVTRDTEPFGIYAGVPARLVRLREDAEKIAHNRWWDWSIPYLLNNTRDLQRLAVSGAKHEYRVERPRLALNRFGPTNAELCGFIDGDVLHPLSEAPAGLLAYMKQMGTGAGRYWLADAWAA